MKLNEHNFIGSKSDNYEKKSKKSTRSHQTCWILISHSFKFSPYSF